MLPVFPVNDPHFYAQAVISAPIFRVQKTNYAPKYTPKSESKYTDPPWKMIVFLPWVHIQDTAMDQDMKRRGEVCVCSFFLGITCCRNITCRYMVHYHVEARSQAHCRWPNHWPTTAEAPRIPRRLQYVWIKEQYKAKIFSISYKCLHVTTCGQYEKKTTGIIQSAQSYQAEKHTSLHSCPIHETGMRWKSSVTADNDGAFQWNTFFSANRRATTAFDPPPAIPDAKHAGSKSCR